MYIHFLCIHVHLFLVFAFRDARFLSGLYGRFSYIVITFPATPVLPNGDRGGNGAIHRNLTCNYNLHTSEGALTEFEANQRYIHLSS
jgi:hypothetical protein